MIASVDTTVTIALFVALIPAVGAAFMIGIHLMMLGDNISADRPRRIWGIYAGVIGVPLSAVAIYLTAAVLAWKAHGLTFYYPLIGLAAGAAAVVGISALADKLARRR
ncbi:hypothetical protein ABH105_33060 [Mycolicibacterium smegmatis]|nr:hypothetical protein [Mycolicibacterium smegmatis]UAK53892.1 hypothetical protein K8P01_25495 [Mycolicibacterium smegmatis]CKH32365.1 Uncharacterised protein [Mycolicibacterium smegmatis]